MAQGPLGGRAHLGVQLEHAAEEGEGVGPHGGEEDRQGDGLSRG